MQLMSDGSRRRTSVPRSASYPSPRRAEEGEYRPLADLLQQAPSLMVDEIEPVGQVHSLSLQSNMRAAVTRAGVQEALLVLCPSSSSSSSARRARSLQGAGPSSSSSSAASDAGSGLVLQGSIAFANPYGFLPAIRMGDWPVAGALTMGYAVLLVAFGVVCVLAWRQGNLLQLHVLLAVLALAGLQEAATRFGMLNQRNISGNSPCCPPTPDLIAAEVLGVAKRAAFRGVFLALALGYGVVVTELPRTTWVGSAVMLAVYSGLSLATNIAAMATYTTRGGLLEISALMLDFCILGWTYVTFMSTIEALHEAGERAKRDMYLQLLGVMRAFGLSWICISLLVLLARTIPSILPWRFQFMLDAFWEIMYLGLLAAVCWIWLPGQATA